MQRYLNKVSGPLLDRIDIHIEVTPVGFDELSSRQQATERSENIRDRVIRARMIQTERFKSSRIHCNAQMTSRQLKDICQIDESGQEMLKSALKKLNLSARAYDRILKVSRTIADLEGSSRIECSHLAEAINYRSLDRESWGEGCEGRTRKGCDPS